MMVADTYLYGIVVEIMNNATKPNFAFFGTPDIAVTALEEMATFGYLPSLVVCNPDAPVGRKQIITPPPVKVWAEACGIPVFQPTSLKDREKLTPLTNTEFNFFVVLAYGKLMPEWLIKLPKYGTINAHPSLLPKFRGASPIRSTLLHDLSACGVTIIQMDAELDHGPILVQQAVELYGLPIPGTQLDGILAHISGCLLVDVMQKLPTGEIAPTPQNHSKATFCTKITKDMAELQLDPYNLPTGEEALTMYRKICAFDGWPGSFFLHNGKRIKIIEANYNDVLETLSITRVIPEGKRETEWNNWLKTN
jgi:methionyl-tRNA formyltransferase